MMKTALSFAFSLVAGAALAHPAVISHEHPHDWSVLPGADIAVVALVAAGLGVIALAYRQVRAVRVQAKRSLRDPK